MLTGKKMAKENIEKKIHQISHFYEKKGNFFKVKNIKGKIL